MNQSDLVETVLSLLTEGDYMTEKEKDWERLKRIIQEMNIMDDDFFVKIAEDISAMEEILQVFLQDRGIRLKWTKSQVSLRNIGTRSVVVDSLCKAQGGKLYSIEMEKANKDDHQKRVRYNSSNIDTLITEKGIHFKDIPELCMIYISKTDFFKMRRCIYHVRRVVQENGTIVDNGVREIYVNARIDDGSEIAELMKYIKNTRGEHRLFPKLSARVKYLREDKKGVETMCEAVEKYAREKARKAARKAKKEIARETAVRFLQNGVSFEIVLKSIPQLSRGELETICREMAVL